MYKSDTEWLKQAKTGIWRLRGGSIFVFSLLVLLLTARTALAAGLFSTEIRGTD